VHFNYRARDKYGKLITGTMDVDTVATCSEKLHEMDLVPIQIKQPGIIEKLNQLLAGRVKANELNAFTRQLATLQQAGIPLLSGLRSLEKQTQNPRFKKIIGQLGQDLENGMSLNEAFSRHPSVFDKLYINMVKAGEISGNLDNVLDRVAQLNERNAETRGKIQAALRYPLLTFLSMIASFLVIVMFVIPRFAALFARFDADLPLPTRILLKTYDIVSNYWFFVLAGIIAFAFLFRYWVRTTSGRYQWHKTVLSLPIFGPLLHEIYMSRFCVNLAMLLDSGLPILQALDLVGEAVQNAYIHNGVIHIRSEVSGGKGMAEPMQETGLFSPMVTQMIAIGEETGQVGHLLRQVAGYYDRESDFKIKNLTTLIEPIFIVVMGIMVLILALGVFLPMWNVVNLFKS